MTENPAAPEGPAAEAAVPSPVEAPSAVEVPPAGALEVDGSDVAVPSATSAAANSPQSSLAAPRGLSYAVDIVFCIDVTGSMDPIIDAVKANALGFYDDVQSNLTEKGKNVAQLRVRVIAFRDFTADGDSAVEESPFFTLPSDRAGFSEFVNGLVAQGGGDAPVGSGGGGVGDQLTVVHHRRPTSPGDRGLDRPAGSPAKPIGATC